MKITKKMLKYEAIAMKSNFFILFFGIFFPIFLTSIIVLSVGDDFPGALKIKTQIALSMMLIIPLSINFIGIGATSIIDFEKNIPQRMGLFGFKHVDMFATRLIAYLVIMVLSMTTYFTYCSLVIKIMLPTFIGILIILLFVLLISTGLIALAYSIANLVPKFGPGYGVVMGLYFMFMLLGGMMGLRVERMPSLMKSISKILPFSYFQSDAIYSIWTGKESNLMPIIQSTIFFVSLCVIILLISFKVKKRRVS